MRIDEFDWDNLIILDAARHDLYEEVNGSTPKRRTVGSSSEEFIEKTFGSEHTDEVKQDWNEVVVITANPHYTPELFKQATGKTPEETFKDVYPAYKNRWNDNLGTVTPDAVNSQVMEAVSEHGPETKYLIHFMQPHTPFIGGWSETEVTQDKEREMTVWDLLETGEYTDQEVWTAYQQNLKTVMNSAKLLDNRLLGDTVITADHGNAFGENNEYGHPSGSKNPVLRQVPLHRL